MARDHDDGNIELRSEFFSNVDAISGAFDLKIAYHHFWLQRVGFFEGSRPTARHIHTVATEFKEPLHGFRGFLLILNDENAQMLRHFFHHVTICVPHSLCYQCEFK